MTVGEKLSWCFGSVSLAAMALGFAAISYTTQLGNELDRSIGRTQKTIQLLDGIKAELLNMRLGNRGVLLYGSIDSHKDVDSSRRSYEQGGTAIHRQVEQLKPLLDDRDGLARLQTIEEGVAAYRAAVVEVDRIRATGQFREAVRVNGEKTKPIGVAISAAADALLESQKKISEGALRQAGWLRTSARVVVTGLLLVCLVAAIAAGASIRSLYRALQSVSHDLSMSSSQVADAAAQVAESSQHLAEGTTNQAASIEETAASIQQIASTSTRNTEASSEVARLVNGALNAGANLHKAAENVKSAVVEIDKSSGEISGVMQVINEIAFQTKLLALNAAVEAARAGDAGLGFAVVADEVRNLAQKSSQAAEQTEALIQRSLTAAREGDSSVAQLESTVTANDRVHRQILDRANEVAEASRQQMSEVNQITRTMDAMSQTLQNNAARAEEGAAAGAELNGQSDHLREVTRRLGVLTGA